MIKCERCGVVIGERIEPSGKEKQKKKKFYDFAKIAPCCKAELCGSCYEIMLKKNKCFACGGAVKTEKKQA